MLRESCWVKLRKGAATSGRHGAHQDVQYWPPSRTRRPMALRRMSESFRRRLASRSDTWRRRQSWKGGHRRELLADPKRPSAQRHRIGGRVGTCLARSGAQEREDEVQDEPRPKTGITPKRPVGLVAAAASRRASAASPAEREARHPSRSLPALLACPSLLSRGAGAAAPALALRLAAAVRAADACLRLRAATDLLLAPALVLRRHRLLLVFGPSRPVSRCETQPPRVHYSGRTANVTSTTSSRAADPHERRNAAREVVVGRCRANRELDSALILHIEP